jgi:hypothetical protein
VNDQVRERRCDRARAWAALAPDGELAVLEQRLLEAHLSHCLSCRCFADDVAAIAAELRSAGAERSRRRVVVPAAPARRSAYARARGVAAVAAVAVMALGIAARTPLGPEAEPESPRPGAPPAKVDEAGLQTLRLLRQEALLSSVEDPDRPSRTFGNRPA